jgi:uncharacterized protein (DUF885 family)
MRQLLVIPAILLTLLAPPGARAGSAADQAASALFDADWQWRLQTEPEYATLVGDYRFDATLADTSLAAARSNLAHARAMLEQARQIPREQLSGSNPLSHDLFIYQKEQLLRGAAFVPFHPQPITTLQGIHVSLVQTAAQMPFATELDYRNYLARLNAVPAHVAGIIEQLREGVRTGWTAPRAAVRPVPGMLRQLRESAVDGALGQPFRQIPATIDKPVRDALAASGPEALRTKVMPALQELEDYLRKDYLPAARESIGASALPGGQPYYAFLIAQHTGSSMTAAEIHALGLKEVARIQAQMPAAIARTGFAGSFTQFATFANNDPRLFAATPEALLARYRRLLDRAAAGMPKLFASVPTQELLVKPAPAEAGAELGAAWYEAGPSERPAALVINTARLATHPLWEAETLALHEGMPGHHMQAARVRELGELPPFRRYGWNAAFGEGWALYAESLGPELGFFKDAFSAFGRLNAELFRAARLVVDTGIHSKGWSRQQALDFMNANTANPVSDNEIEVDRYIAWPAQALGYKLGELKIKALREQAQSALGERFDVRRFHAVVLDNGPLPLPLLEQQVTQWLAAAAPKPAPVPQPK